MHSKFKYLLDPLFILSLAIYAANKSSILGITSNSHGFGSHYLNDLLLIPVLVPIILFSTRLLGYRDSHFPPTFLEILTMLVIWAIAFELIGPLFFGKGISDPLDVLAYSIGGLISWIIWNRRHLLETLRLGSSAH